MNDEWVSKGVKNITKKFLESNENENTTFPNLRDIRKTDRGKEVYSSKCLHEEIREVTNKKWMIHRRALETQDNPKIVNKKKSLRSGPRLMMWKQTEHKESMEQKLVLWKYWQTLGQTNQEREDLN